LDRRSGNPETEEFLQPLDEEAREQERKLLRRQYRLLMELIMEAMADREEISLQEVTEYCRTIQREDILQHRAFYHFWILLHQRSPLVVEEDDESRQETLLGEMMEILQDRARRLTVVEKQEVIDVTDRYSIRDMQLRLEVQDNAI
jgi:hypothetical protein